MKYLAVFGASASSMLAFLFLGSLASETEIGSGHIVLAVVVGVLIAGMVWLFDNEPPQDGEDRVTMLWRS